MVLSHVWLFATLWAVICQFPLSTGFSRQEYWSGLPFPTFQKIFLSLRLNPHLFRLLNWQVNFFVTEPVGKPDYKEGWGPKTWHFWTVVLETTLESPLDCKGIQLVHPTWNQSWIFIGRSDAETPILCPPDAKNWLIGKKPGCWERLKKGRERNVRGWDCCMASPTQWTHGCVNSGSWWWTGRPGMLQSMGSQKVRHDWATEFEQIDECFLYLEFLELFLCLEFLKFLDLSVKIFQPLFVFCFLPTFPENFNYTCIWLVIVVPQFTDAIFFLLQDRKSVV